MNVNERKQQTLAATLLSMGSLTRQMQLGPVRMPKFRGAPRARLAAESAVAVADPEEQKERAKARLAERQYREVQRERQAATLAAAQAQQEAARRRSAQALAKARKEARKRKDEPQDAPQTEPEVHHELPYKVKQALQNGKYAGVVMTHPLFWAYCKWLGERAPTAETRNKFLQLMHVPEHA